MPKVNDYGTAGAANQAIGGVPTVHYFDFASKGRGQVVRLFFEEAGIAYKDIRYSFEEYPKVKEEQLREKNPLGSIPVIELNGRILTQSYAILRKFARNLKAYDGKNDEEMYWVDAMCDIALDWRTCFVNAFLSPNQAEDYPKHAATTRVNFLKGLNQQLQSHDLSNSGPFVIGNEITYADMVIYQVCHDEGLTKEGQKGLKDYPRLVKLVQAVEARPNVRKFLDSDKYLG